MWRFAQPGAAYLTKRHRFWAYRQCQQMPPWTGVGEVHGSPITYRRDALNVGPVLPGTAPDGTDADFLGQGQPPESVLVAGGRLPPPVCGAGPALGLTGGEQRPSVARIVRAGAAVSTAVGQLA